MGRVKRWVELGVCERIWRAAEAIFDWQGQLNRIVAVLDGSFVAAKRGGEDRRTRCDRR
jgi:hypothetical protein